MASIDWQPGGNLQSLLIILGTPLAEVSIAGGRLTIQSAGQAELEAAAATYAADPELYILTPLKRNQKQFLQNRVEAFTIRHYSRPRRELFHALLTETIVDALPDRRAYIRQGLSWLKFVAGKLIEAEAAVDLAATREEIQAVQIDFEALAAIDPAITIKAALAIVQ